MYFISFIQHSTDPLMVSPLDIEHVIQKEIVIKSSNKYGANQGYLLQPILSIYQVLETIHCSHI
jgi:hypothetical protein